MSPIESIEIGQYKKDSRSNYVYLGPARVKAVELQRTEAGGMRLLDILIEVPLKSGEACEFLIRFETPEEYVADFLEKLQYAIDHPLPHPWMNDLFEKAVMGWTFRELMEDMKKKSGEEPKKKS